jgi:sugar phosphate isomerase/epimerase
MAQACYHPSIEGAQHGAKSLPEFLDYAKRSGATGAQPSNYMVQGEKGFQKAKDIKQLFADRGMTLDGISAHCPFWVHTTAWTGSPTIRPFLPPAVAKKSENEIEKWAESYVLKLLDLCAELGINIVPMFWGALPGWEIKSLSGIDSEQGRRSEEIFVNKTERIRTYARKSGIYLAHEIHWGTAVASILDFQRLLEACDGDRVLAVTLNPLNAIEDNPAVISIRGRVLSCHANSPNVPALCNEETKPFTPRNSKILDFNPEMDEKHFGTFMDLLSSSRYQEKYCEVTGSKSPPLVFTSAQAMNSYFNQSAKPPFLSADLQKTSGSELSVKKLVLTYCYAGCGLALGATCIACGCLLYPQLPIACTLISGGTFIIAATRPKSFQIGPC